MANNVLEGKTITAIEIADDKEALRFITTDGEIIVRCQGDCCSNTWVEGVELPVNGFPAAVISTLDIDMPDLGSPDKWDVIAYYGFKIVTDKGDIIIDYRNSSNGYYGGNLCWPNERYYPGVYGQNQSNEKWLPVKDASK